MRKTHGTIEEHSRIDSFDLAKPTGSIMIYNDKRFLDYLRAFTEDDNREEIYLSSEGDVLEKRLMIENRAGKYYWICPKCGKRARYLYPGKHILELRCGKCAGLNYRIQQEYHDCIWYADRALQYAIDYLQYKPPHDFAPYDILSTYPKRPKEMSKDVYDKRLKRFRRMCNQYERQFYIEAAWIMNAVERQRKNTKGRY